MRVCFVYVLIVCLVDEQFFSAEWVPRGTCARKSGLFISVLDDLDYGERKGKGWFRSRPSNILLDGLDAMFGYHIGSATWYPFSIQIFFPRGYIKRDSFNKISGLLTLVKCKKEEVLFGGSQLYLSHVNNINLAEV